MGRLTLFDHKLLGRAQYRHSPETRDKISAALRKLGPGHWSRVAAGVARYCSTHPKKQTPLETALYSLLEQAGFEVERQKRFGRYVVDAWLPRERLVFEADGWFWHQDKEKEVRRDAYLMGRGALAVVHLSEMDF